MSDNLYFEPPSRLQLVDKLAHLLRFSNTLLVLAGPSGAGVSTVVDQLHTQAVEDDVYILSLNLTGSTNLKGLMKLLNDAMDELVNPQDSAEQDDLSLLHKKIDTLANLQRKLLISIDNADFLSDEAAESLVNLISANEGKVAVTLAGSENLVVRSKELVNAQGLVDSLHIEILSPFNRTETEEFIQLRFLRGNDFSKKQLSEIYLNSEGYPGRITQMTSEMIKSGKITLSGKSSILPVPHIIGIAVLLTAITGVLLWQSSSDGEQIVEPELAANTGKSSQELPLNIAEDSQGEVSSPERELEDEIASLSQRIKAQEQLIEQAKEDSESQGEDDTALTPEVIDEETGRQVSQNTDVELIDQIEPSTDEAENIAQDTVSEPVNPELVDSEIVSIEPAPDAVTDQVIEQPAQVVQAVEVKTEVQQQPVDQPQPVEPSVERQLAQLSADLKKNIDPKLFETPAPIEVASTAVVVEELSVKKPEVSTPVVAPTPKVEVKPVQPAPKKQVKQVAKPANDAAAEKWLSHKAILNWPSTGYTLQLLGARSQSSAIRFLQTMPNSEKMHYYKTLLKNRDWNVIIYGQYASRSAASAAIAKLPKALQDLKPWPKTIKSVKSSIKK